LGAQTLHPTQTRPVAILSRTSPPLASATLSFMLLVTRIVSIHPESTWPRRRAHRYHRSRAPWTCSYCRGRPLQTWHARSTGLPCGGEARERGHVVRVQAAGKAEAAELEGGQIHSTPLHGFRIHRTPSSLTSLAPSSTPPNAAPTPTPAGIGDSPVAGH